MRRRAAGFTLLEMMIAMAILAGSITWLIVGFSRNIRAENHAKLMTTATFLARGKMTEFEDELYEKGFGEFEKELSGTFEHKGFKRFTWNVVVDKVELPNPADLQNALGKANEAKAALTGQDPSQTSSSSTTSSTSQNPMSMGAAAMSSQFGIIKDVLQQGIRRVTVKVLWNEGRKPYDVTVIAYYVDPRRVDQAVQMTIPGNIPGMPGGTGGTPGATPGTGTGSPPAGGTK